MKLHGSVKRLRRGRTLRLALDPSDRLLVARGCVWLTRTGDPKDYVLRVGQEFSPARRGEFVLEALGETAVLGLKCSSREASPARVAVPSSSPAFHAQMAYSR